MKFDQIFRMDISSARELLTAPIRKSLILGNPATSDHPAYEPNGFDSVAPGREMGV